MYHILFEVHPCWKWSRFGRRIVSASKLPSRNAPSNNSPRRRVTTHSDCRFRRTCGGRGFRFHIFTFRLIQWSAGGLSGGNTWLVSGRPRKIRRSVRENEREFGTAQRSAKRKLFIDFACESRIPLDPRWSPRRDARRAWTLFRETDHDFPFPPLFVKV